MRIKSKKTIGIFLAVTTLVTGLFSQTPVMAKSGFKIKTENGKKVLVKYNGNASKVKVPEGVEVIKDSAFCENSKIKSVELPKSIEIIDSFAFYKCKNLEKVKIPKGLKRIEQAAFSYCNKIKTIKINKNLEFLGEYNFTKWSSLKKVTVAKGNKHFKVKNGVLYSKDMKKLYVYPAAMKGKTKFTIPKSVEYVCGYAFAYNKYLKEVIVRHWLNFGEVSFANSKSLKKVVFERSYGYPPAFINCKKLETVILPEDLPGISYREFEGCESLTTINLPSTIKYIGEGAFSDCKNLININLPEGLETIGKYAFMDCDSLSTLDFPQSLQEIEYWAFKGCTKLEKPTLPDTVKVHEGAFDE